MYVEGNLVISSFVNLTNIGHLECVWNYPSHFTNINLFKFCGRLCKWQLWFPSLDPCPWRVSSHGDSELGHKATLVRGTTQMWHKRRSEKRLCFGVCPLLPFFVLRPPWEEIWAHRLEHERHPKWGPCRATHLSTTRHVREAIPDPPDTSWPTRWPGKQREPSRAQLDTLRQDNPPANLQTQELSIIATVLSH